jgi:hypothetical protein
LLFAQFNAMLVHGVLLADTLFISAKDTPFSLLFQFKGN